MRAGCDVLSWRIQRTGSEIIRNDGFQKLLPGIPACVKQRRRKMQIKEMFEKQIDRDIKGRNQSRSV